MDLRFDYRNVINGKLCLTQEEFDWLFSSKENLDSNADWYSVETALGIENSIFSCIYDRFCNNTDYTSLISDFKDNYCQISGGKKREIEWV